MFGKQPMNRSVEQIVNQSRLRWLGHVLRMDNHRLPVKCLYQSCHISLRKRSGCQSTSWNSNLKTLTTRLSRVGRCRLPGWNAHDDSSLWLDTLKEMAANRSQWRSCIYFLSSD